MGKHPKFKELEKSLKLGKDFTLTDAQYEKKTGIPLPKDKRYILKSSALARKASEYDFYLELIEKQVIFKKKK